MTAVVTVVVLGCAAAGVEGHLTYAHRALAHLAPPEGNHTLVPCGEWLSSTASPHEAPLRDVLTEAHPHAAGLPEGRSAHLIWVEKIDDTYERHRITPLLRALAAHGECSVLRLGAVSPSSVFTPRRNDSRTVVEAGNVVMVVWDGTGVRVEVVQAVWYHALSLVRMFEVLSGRPAQLWPCAVGGALDTHAPVGDVVRALSRTHVVDAERVCVHEEVWEDADGPLRVHTVEWLPRTDTLAVEHVPLRVRGDGTTRTLAVLRGHALAHVPAIPARSPWWSAHEVTPETPWRALLHAEADTLVELAAQQVDVMRVSGAHFLSSLRVSEADARAWAGQERPPWAPLKCHSLLTAGPPTPDGEEPRRVLRFFHTEAAGARVRLAHHVVVSPGNGAPPAAACVRTGRFDLRQLTATHHAEGRLNNLMRVLRGECVRCGEQPAGVVRERGGVLVEWPQWQPHVWDDLRIAHLELFLRALLAVVGHDVPVHVHVRACEAGDTPEPAVWVRWEGYEAEVALHASVEASTRGPASAMQMAEWFWAHRALVVGDDDSDQSALAWHSAHRRVCGAIARRASFGLMTPLPAGAGGREALLLAMAEQMVSLNDTGCVQPAFSWYPSDAPAAIREGFDDSALALRGATFARWGAWAQGHTLPTLGVDELHAEAGAVAVVVVPGTSFNASDALWSDLLTFVPADALFVLPRAQAAALPARAGIRPQRRPVAFLVDRHRYRTWAQPLAPSVMERRRGAQEVLRHARLRMGEGGSEHVMSNPWQLVAHGRAEGDEHVSQVLTVGDFRRCQDRTLSMAAHMPRLPMHAIHAIPRGFLVWVPPLVRGDTEREWAVMDAATALSDAMDRRDVLVWYGSPANVTAWPHELRPVARALTHWAAAHGGEAVLLPILDGRVVPLPLSLRVPTALHVHTLRLPARDTAPRAREHALVRGTGTLAGELAHRVWLVAHGRREEAVGALTLTPTTVARVAPPRGALARWATEHPAAPLAERNSTFVGYHTRGALPMRVQREAMKVAPATLVQEYTGWSGHAKNRWEHMRACLPEHTPDRMHVAWHSNGTHAFDIPALLHTNGEGLPRSPACAAVMYVRLYPSATPPYLYGAGSGRVALYTPPAAHDTPLPRGVLRALALKCNGSGDGGGGQAGEELAAVRPTDERHQQNRFFSNLPFSAPQWLAGEEYPDYAW